MIEIPESLSNSWLELMGIDSSKYKVVMVDEELISTNSSEFKIIWGDK